MHYALNAVISFLKVVVVILFIAHWIVYVFYYIDSIDLETETVCLLTIANMQDKGNFNKYVISLY